MESEFHMFVQPSEHTRLSEFCTELTGITQVQWPTLFFSFPLILLHIQSGVMDHSYARISNHLQMRLLPPLQFSTSPTLN